MSTCPAGIDRRLELDVAGRTAAVLFSGRGAAASRVSATWTTTINIGLEAPIEIEHRDGTTRGRVVITPAGIMRVSRPSGPVLTLLLDADAHRRARDATSRGRPFVVDAPDVLSRAVTVAERFVGGPAPVIGDAFALAERLFPLGSSGLPDPRIAKVIARLRERPASLEDLAASLGLTTGYLSERFAQVVGLPMRSWLLWQRVRRSLELLAGRRSGTEPEEGAAGIACAAGFSDQPHMVRTFSRLLGNTPGELREALHPKTNRSAFNARALRRST